MKVKERTNLEVSIKITPAKSRRKEFIQSPLHEAKRKQSKRLIRIETSTTETNLNLENIIELMPQEVSAESNVKQDLYQKRERERLFSQETKQKFKVN